MKSHQKELGSTDTQQHKLVSTRVLLTNRDGARGFQHGWPKAKLPLLRLLWVTAVVSIEIDKASGRAPLISCNNC